MSYELDKQIVVLTAKTVDVLLQENSDSLVLYHFYIKTARRQRTNKVKAKDIFCMRGLKWGKVRFTKAKKVLLAYKLVEPFQRRKDNKIEGHYIKVNYLWKEATVKEVSYKYQNELVGKATSTDQPTNALSKLNINALSKKREMLAKHKSISYLENIPKEDLRDFVTKYACYPKDVIDKASSLIDYCKSKGKKYKDYKAFLNNALRKDYGLRPVTNPGEGDFIW